MKTKLRPIKSSKLAKRPLTQGYDEKKEIYSTFPKTPKNYNFTTLLLDDFSEVK